MDEQEYSDQDERQFNALLEAAGSVEVSDSEFESYSDEGEDEKEASGAAESSEEESESDSMSGAEFEGNSSEHSAAQADLARRVEHENATLSKAAGDLKRKLVKAEARADRAEGLLRDLEKENDRLRKLKTTGVASLVSAGNGEDVPKVVEAAQGEFKAKQVACGWNHCLAISATGQLYAWGKGGEGQLGLGDTKPRTIPTEVNLKKVRSVFAAGNQSFAVSETGNVYAWGENAQGQLGLGDRQKRNVPTLVRDLQAYEIVALASGKSHTLAVTEEGEVYGWGDNSQGQLGLGDRNARVTPTHIAYLSANTVRNVKAGARDSIMLVEGEVEKIAVEPSRSDKDQYFAFLRNSLSNLTTKRLRMSADLREELNVLRRKVNAFEAELAKQNEAKESDDDCRLIVETIEGEMQSLDYDYWNQLVIDIERLQSEKEMLLAQSKGGMGKGSVKKEELLPLDDDSELSSLADSQSQGALGKSVVTDRSKGAHRAPELIKERERLLQLVEQLRGDPLQAESVRVQEAQLEVVTTQLRQVTGLVEAGPSVFRSSSRAFNPDAFEGGHADEAVDELCARIYESFKAAQGSTVENLQVDRLSLARARDRGGDKAPQRSAGGVPTVKDLLLESNLRIASIVEDTEVAFQRTLQDDVPNVLTLLPRLFLEYAKALRRCNDFMEGMLSHTIHRADRLAMGPPMGANKPVREPRSRVTC